MKQLLVPAVFFVSLLACSGCSKNEKFFEMAKPVKLQPIEGNAEFLTVKNGNSSRKVSINEIETAGTVRVFTKTYWSGTDIAFDGVLLRDLLKYLGLESARQVRFRAYDDYYSLIPCEDWQTFPVLFVTRINGKPLRRREKGPFRIVYPLLDGVKTLDLQSRVKWIWSISILEVSGEGE